ncbi:MAG: N-formylglutamate amidohydrolase [Psychrosphaera sp.]|nr:N-formylglutamate amidohydrolase [Psychrosphaera sp.]
MQQTRIVLTCEHASNNIPPQYQTVFADAQDVLTTHEGWDIGVPEVVEALGKRLDVVPHLGEYSRLLVDLNRSAHHRRLFSSYTKPLSKQQRDEIKCLYYRPYRDAVHQNVLDVSAEHRAVHLSIHSFTPEYDGVVRQCYIGLLYDPSRPLESEFALSFQEDLARLLPGIKVRRNYPYTGVQDGIIPALRNRFDGDQYFGLEIEFNQALFDRPDYQADWMTIFVECLVSRALNLSSSNNANNSPGENQ